MPCLKGRLPVAIDVHNMGDKTGDNVAKLPMTPFSTNRCVDGIKPQSINR